MDPRTAHWQQYNNTAIEPTAEQADLLLHFHQHPLHRQNPRRRVRFDTHDGLRYPTPLERSERPLPIPSILHRPRTPPLRSPPSLREHDENRHQRRRQQQLRTPPRPETPTRRQVPRRTPPQERFVQVPPIRSRSPRQIPQTQGQKYSRNSI